MSDHLTDIEGLQRAGCHAGRDSDPGLQVRQGNARILKAERIKKSHALVDRVRAATVIASEILVLEGGVPSLVEKTYDETGPFLMDLAEARDTVARIVEIIGTARSATRRCPRKRRRRMIMSTDIISLADYRRRPHGPGPSLYVAWRHRENHRGVFNFVRTFGISLDWMIAGEGVGPLSA